MTMQKKLEIIKSFGLQVEEAEPYVYKVLNPNITINTDKLKWALKDCILIISSDITYEKLDSGVHAIVSKLFYIVINRDNKKLAYKYDTIAEENMGDSMLVSYRYKPDAVETIDTIYRENEY